MKNRKCRQKVKQFLKHSTPTSSVLNHIATNYKEYYLKFIHRHKFLSQSFAALKHIHKAKKRSCTSHHPTTMCVLNSSTILKNAIFDNDKFCVSDKKLMMSGDIELNPGPLTNVTSKVRASQSKNFGRRGVIGAGRGLDWAWSTTGGEGGGGGAK